jgi:hypothetical protein
MTHVNPLSVQVTTYSSHLLSLLSSRPLAASMTFHHNMGVSTQWWLLIHHLGTYLSPTAAAAATATIVPPLEHFSPMEGVEFSGGDSFGTIVREYSPEMDVCEESGARAAFAAPTAFTAAAASTTSTASAAPKASPPHASSWREAAPSPSPEYEAPPKKQYRQRC